MEIKNKSNKRKMSESTIREAKIVTSLEDAKVFGPGDSIKCVVLSADPNLSDSQAPSSALMKPVDDEIVVRLVVWSRVQFEALKLVPSEIAVLCNVSRVVRYGGILHILPGYKSRWELKGNGAFVRSREEVTKEVAARTCDVLKQVVRRGRVPLLCKILSVGKVVEHPSRWSEEEPVHYVDAIIEMVNWKTTILHCWGEFADEIVNLKDCVVLLKRVYVKVDGTLSLSRSKNLKRVPPEINELSTDLATFRKPTSRANLAFHLLSTKGDDVELVRRPIEVFKKEEGDLRAIVFVKRVEDINLAPLAH